jgi:hypothetical protein
MERKGIDIMRKRHTVSEADIAEEMCGLFGPLDHVLILMNMGLNGVYGVEGIPGLRLVGCSLFDEVYRDHSGEEKCLEATPSGQTKNPDLTRLAKIREGLEQFKKIKNGSWVICYHVHGTPAWKLDWSRRLTRGQAVERVLQFVKSTMLLDA